MKFINLETSSEDLDNKNLIKLSPYGLQLSADGDRPILLLKDEKGQRTMPVFLNHLEAGVTITQSNKSIVPTTPHRVTELLLESLHLKIESCVFTEIKSNHQIVRLALNGKSDSGHQDTKYIDIKAEEAMSLCLHLSVPLFASLSYMDRSRVLSSENRDSKKILVPTEASTRPHKYIM